MQYIQLQSQLTSDIPAPPSGSYNFYINSETKNITIQNENNQHINASVSIVEVTKSEIDTLVVQSSLVNGNFYMITNAASGSITQIQEGGTTIILQATSENTLSKKGNGLFWNPRYENPNVPTVPPDTNYCVWDNTHRYHITGSYGFFDHDEYVQIVSATGSTYAFLQTNIGNNYLTLVPYDNTSDTFLKDANNLPFSIIGDNSSATAYVDSIDYLSSYAPGDKAIWGGRVWTNLSGSLGYTNDASTLNPEDWSKIAYNTTDYDLVCDIIEYEYEHDNISYRKSNTNEVRNDFYAVNYFWGYNDIIAFPWGNPIVNNVSLNNTYIYNLVNFPNRNNNYMDNIKFNFGEFDADIWGRDTEIYNIESNQGIIYNLELGNNTLIYNLKLNIDSNIYNIKTYDNDYGYDIVYDCVIENNSGLGNLFFYSNSYIGSIKLDIYSSFRNINLYGDCDVFDINLDAESEFGYIDLGFNSSIYRINLGFYSYFGDMEIDTGSEIYDVNIGIDSYIEYIALINYSEMSYISLDNNSYIENVYPNYNYSGSFYVGNITLGQNSYIDGIALDYNSSLHNISFAPNSSIGEITIGQNSSIDNINIGSDSGFGGMTLYNNTHIADFEMGVDSNFCCFDISGSGVGLYDFYIGQGAGFCCNSPITSSMYNITIDRGFSNMLNTQLQDPSGSFGISYGRPLINLDNRSVVTFNISGVGNSLNFQLPNGDYEGQEITFIVDSDGTHTIQPYEIQIWSPNIKMTGYYYNLGDHDGAIAPFARIDKDNPSSGYKWKNMTKAVWTNGKWYSDSEFYND
jgi:hypothetical protein